MNETKQENALPPLPNGHNLKVGDRIEMPVYGKGKLKGTVMYVNAKFGEQRYEGLAMLGDDNVYYQLQPEIIRKI